MGLTKIKFICRLAAFLSIILIIFSSLEEAFANDHTLESIHIHTFIHNDEFATITETRKAYLTEGTENYIVIVSLGLSEITDFVVHENGITYEFIENWNLNASREEKTYKNGIVKTNDGYELCWGIGEYGYHEYIVQYKVTNFIKQLDDAQILFWRYINDQTNIPPQHIETEIETYRPLTYDNERIWGFGFEGEIHFKNNKVVARSDEAFDSDHYATILIPFPENEFQTQDILDMTFQEVYDRAMESSDYISDSSWEDTIYFIIFILLVAILFYVGPIGLIKIMILKIIAFFRAIKRLMIKKDIGGMYHRDLPFQHHFLDLFYLLKKLGLTNEKHLLSALF